MTMMATFWMCPMVRQRCLCWVGVSAAVSQGVVENSLGDVETYPMFTTVFFVLVIVPFPSDWQVVDGHYVRYSSVPVVGMVRLPGLNAGIVQALIGQFCHGIADVDLAGYDVGDEAGVVFVY